MANKTVLTLEGDKPVEKIWEGDAEDELGIVEAVSDAFASFQSGVRDDGNPRNVTTVRCLKLGKVLSGDEVTVANVCAALADGETTFRVGERAVVKSPTWIDLKFRYMPYSLFGLVKKLI